MRKNWKLLVKFIKIARKNHIASFNIVTNADTIIISTESIGNPPNYKLEQLRLKYK